MQLHVRKIGNSLGIILPKSLIQSMNIDNGDSLYVIEEEDGAKLTPYDQNFDKVVAAYTKFSKKYRNALRELAK